MIPKHKVDEILMTAQIEDVIADFVNIKKSGSSIKGSVLSLMKRHRRFTLFPKNKSLRILVLERAEM